jgi:hypothetical protein
MVTEGLPVGCTSCFDDDDDDLRIRRPSTSSQSLAVAGGSRANSSSSDKENPVQLSIQTLGIKPSSSPASAIETPPGSPRVVALQSGLNHNRRDSSFRKTYDENDKKRAVPCEGCALTLPKKTKEGSDGGNMFDNSGPILRTRKPYERVTFPHESEPSPPKSSSSESSSSDEATSKLRRDARPTSSNSSFTSVTSHTHYLDYTSTHEPLSPSSFSIIRQSCLRTLSCETLPPSANQFSSAPSSPNPFSNSPSFPATSTSSGGPIFFGDPLAGYTTAYIFRIPDPSARGRRRVYALMALSTHRERLAMQTFSFLGAAFRELAAWIQGLAEAELERSDNLSGRGGGDERLISNQSTPTSSFLSGRSRGPDGKVGMSLRARGLAELVGLPDFFIELHTKFVRLLIELGLLLGS